MLESKGDHLAGNKDTKYKEDVFAMCSTHFVAKAVGGGKPDQNARVPRKIHFKVVPQKSWQQGLLDIFKSASGDNAPPRPGKTGG